ncbi:MAG: VTT domain-containing protein [Planctomycetota bacterium]|nr:VTT domain-containing protein [Planctomycetota bacterium]
MATSDDPKDPNDPTDPEAVASASASPSLLKRLYLRILAEAETSRGPTVLAVVAFTESSFFPIPPDPLLIALGIGAPRRAIPLAILTTVMSVLGGLLGYAIGAWMMDTVGDPIIAFFSAQTSFEEVKMRFLEFGFLSVVTAALTPIPYKVITIAAGASGLPLAIFIPASIIGRGTRFIAEGILVWRYGESIRSFIDRWFATLTITAVILGLLGVALLRGYGH